MIARKKIKKPSGVEVISNRYARNNAKKNEVNRARRSKVRTEVKKLLKLIDAKPTADDLKLGHIKVQKVLMSKKSVDVFGFKKCSRLFSRITKRVKLALAS